MVDSFFKNLGLSDQETQIYLALVKLGLTSAFKIAQTTNLPRTTIYRLLEHLKSQGLAEEVIDNKRKLVKPSSLDRLNFLVENQVSEASRLKENLPRIKSQLATESTNSLPGTQVIFYRGQSGITQVLWNSLKTKEILGYSYLTIDDVLGKKLTNQYRTLRTEHGIKERDLLSSNDPYLNLKVLRFIKKSSLFKNYLFRYLPYSKVNINHQIMIYNDVLVFYHWHEGEIFAIEIHNSTIANLQKQIFEVLWGLSKSPESVLKK